MIRTALAAVGLAGLLSLPVAAQELSGGMATNAANVALPGALQNLYLQTHAQCDVVYGVDGTATAASTTFSSTGSTFPASSVGKTIVISGAGASPYSVLTGSSTIASAGSGYAAGDTITLTGGTFSQAAIVKVDTVSAGAVATWHMEDAGVYTVVPSNPVAQGSTSGAGTGFTLTARFVGAPHVTTIASASGTGTITLGAAASNSMSGARWYYGSDDSAALQADFDATKNSGVSPGRVILPGLRCGTSVQLELPVGAAVAGGTNEGEVHGHSYAQTTLFPLAPMTAVLHRNTTFGRGGAVTNLTVDAFGLADYGLWFEGGASFSARDLRVKNAKVTGIRCGNGSTAVTEANLDRVSAYTDNFIFSSKQLPTYQLEMTAACTDATITSPTLDAAVTAYLLNAGLGNHYVSAHGYGYTPPEYQATYGFKFDNGGTVIGGHIDGAKTAGIYINGANTYVSKVLMNTFTGSTTATGVLIADGINQVIVTGISTNVTAMFGANLISQAGTPGLRNFICDNPSATYGQCAGIPRTTVAALPACTASLRGTSFIVTDATGAIAYRGAATGGGTQEVEVLCADGPTWRYN